MKNILNLLLLPLCCMFLTIFTTKATPVIPPTILPDENLLTLTLSLKTDLTCHGDNNGLAVVVALGGVPPFVYAWSNGALGPINANLSAGLYTATVTDLLGATATLNVTINEPAQLLVNVAAQVNINCLNVNGSATVNSTGGTGTALYVWSNGQIGPTVTNLAAGVYLVTATDNNNCTSVKTVNVTADVQLPTVNVNLNGDLQVDCNTPLVSLDATASTGGTNPAYLWTTVNGHIASGATSNLASVDAAGTYLLQVTNNDNGCTNTQAVNVTADVTLPVVNIALGANVDLQLDCLTPQITLDATASAAGPNISYLWTTLNGHIVAGVNSNLATVDQAGVYVLVVTNLATGCTNTQTATVTADINLPIININAGANVDLQLDCSSPQITLDATASAAGPGISYLWTTLNGHIVAGVNANLATVDAAGVYVLLVTNTNTGCTSTQSVTVTADVSLPIVNINVGANVDLQLDCLTPQITLDATASAAGPGISYLWTTINGHIVAGVNANLATVDQAGVYVLVVTNLATGCTSTQSVTVTADVSLPVININVGANVDLQLDCSSPQITLDATASAAGPGITYLWTTVNGHIVAGVNTNLAVVDAAGVYVLLVTNVNTGCTSTQSVTVTADVSLPVANIAIGANVDLQLDCLTPQITLDATASAAGPGITYLWTTVNGHIVAGVNANLATVDAAGVYVLLVTNTATGCTSTQSVTVTADANLPIANIAIGANVDLQIDCLSPQITLDASGSTSGSGITYLWTTVNGHIVGGINTTSLTVDAAGTYVLHLTNASNGCSVTASVDVTANVTTPAISATVTGQLGCSSSSLVINATVSSPGTYTYIWSTVNGSIVTGANTLTPTVNAAGTYSLLVTNTSTGCTATTSVTVTGNPTLNVSVTGMVGVSCFGLANGSATLTVTGGTGPYTYLWNNGMTTSSISGLAAGLYIATVTDAQGCQSVLNITISQPAQISATVATTPASSGQSNGTATLTVTGGTGPYTYQWSNGMTGSSPTGLANGTYTVVVTDAQGCSITVTVVVGGNAPGCTLTIAADVVPTNCGQSIGQATIMAINGTGSLTYQWSNGMTSAHIIGLAAGAYTVTVTDSQGCSATITANIIGNNDTTPPIVITQNATIYINASGQATLAASAINNGSSDACGSIILAVNNQVFDCGQLGPHVVVLTATDQSGNTATATATVTVVNNTAATLTCPSDITINTGSSLVTYDLPTMTNICDNSITPGTLMLVGGLASGSPFPTGTTLVTYATVTSGGTLSTCSFNVTVINEVLTVGVDVSSPSCPGSTDGSATVNVTGGMPPYQYFWVGSGYTTPTVTGLGAGTYTVVVVDNLGNVLVQTVTVTDPTPLNVNIAIVTDNCTGNGSINVTVTGGTQPYTYAWYDVNGNVFATTEDLTSIPSGTYVLVVTDASGCSFTTGPIVVDFVTGTSETELSTFGVVSLAPNPTSNGPVMLSLNLPESSPVRVETYNMSGQQIGTAQEGEFQKGQFTLNFGTFAPGQYLVKVITDNHTYVKKVIRVQ